MSRRATVAFAGGDEARDTALERREETPVIVDTAATLQGKALLVHVLGRLLHVAPEDVEAQRELARVAEEAEREGDIDLALEALGQWVSHGSDAEAARRALQRLALALSAAGSHASALRALELVATPRAEEASTRRGPDDPDWVATKGRALRATGDVAAALRVAQAQLQRGDLDALAELLAQIHQHAPLEWDFAPVLRPLRRARTPGIFLCTLPKSGSVYVQDALARGLGKPILGLGAGGFFPSQAIPMGCIQRLHEERGVYMIHAEPSRHNRIELTARLDRMLIQVRDPRQVLLSWAHFIPEVVRRLDPPQGLHYGTPPDLFERPFEAQLDWHIEHYFGKFVAWIERWLECSRDPDFKTQILFTTTEELSRDPKGFFARVLSFYGINPEIFDMPPPPACGQHNVRRAQSDEWRTELTAAQLARCAEMLPESLCTRFGWPVA